MEHAAQAPLCKEVGDILNAGAYGESLRPQLLENTHHVVYDQAVEFMAR